MGDEVDIYSDLQSAEATLSTNPSADAATNLDLLDTCVIPRQPTPVKAEKNKTLSHSTSATTVTRVLELSSDKVDSEEQNTKPGQPRSACLEKAVAELKNQNSLLKHNISILYATAKHILDVKDKEIATLRTKLDNLIFRRNNKGTGTNTSAAKSSPVPTQCILRDGPAGKANTQMNAEERMHEMSSGLKRLYELGRVPQSKRMELKDVWRLPHHESELKQRETKQSHIKTGSSDSSEVSLASAKNSKLSATRSSYPVHKERYPPPRGVKRGAGGECRQTEENTKLHMVERKRRGPRSPTEPYPRKIARFDHGSREHRGDHSSVKLGEKAHEDKASSFQNGHVSKMPESGSSFSAQMSTKKTSVKSGSVKCVAEKSCSLNKSGPREQCGNHSSVKLGGKAHEDKASSLQNGHVLKMPESGSSSSSQVSTRRMCVTSVSVKCVSEKSCSLNSTVKANAELSPRTRSTTKHGPASKYIANASKTNACPMSPLRKSRTTSLRSTVPSRHLHRRTSSVRPRLMHPSRSLDQERSRRLSDMRERVVRRVERRRSEKADLAGIKCSTKDSKKGADESVSRNALRETKESPKLSTKESTVDKDAEGTSSGIERDLEEGELVSD